MKQRLFGVGASVRVTWSDGVTYPATVVLHPELGSRSSKARKAAQREQLSALKRVVQFDQWDQSWDVVRVSQLTPGVQDAQLSKSITATQVTDTENEGQSNVCHRNRAVLKSTSIEESNTTSESHGTSGSIDHRSKSRDSARESTCTSDDSSGVYNLKDEYTPGCVRRFVAGGDGHTSTDDVRRLILERTRTVRDACKKPHTWRLLTAPGLQAKRILPRKDLCGICNRKRTVRWRLTARLKQPVVSVLAGCDCAAKVFAVCKLETWFESVHHDPSEEDAERWIRGWTQAVRGLDEAAVQTAKYDN
jgi:hypothetical protein